MSPLASCQTTKRPRQVDRDRVNNLMVQAQATRQNGEFEKSISLYTEALREKPDWAEGWWELATIQYKLKQYDLALAAFRHVTSLNPRNGAAFALAGLCEFTLNRYAQSLKDLDHGGSLGLGGDQNLTPVVLYHAALLLTRGGDFENSLDQLGLFVRQENHSPEIVMALGLGTLRLAMLPDEIPPDKRDLVMKAGEAAWQNTSHNVEGARTLFSQLVDEYPTDSSAQFADGIYMMDSDPELAFEEFKKSFALDPSNLAASLKVAFFNLQQGDAQSAMKLAQRALLKSPGDYRVHLVMGRAYLQMNETTKALAELRRTVEAAPDDAESHYYLAQAYRAAGNRLATEREQAEFDRLKKDDNGRTSMNGWWYFAGQYYAKHRYADARDALTKIVAQNPKDSAAWGMMGLCDFELSDFSKSLENLLRARSTGLPPDSSLSDAVHFYLAILLNQSGQPGAAIKELTAASVQQTPTLQTQFVMGLIALRRKTVPAAVPPNEKELIAATGEAAWLLNGGRAAEAAPKFVALIEAHPAEAHLHFNYGVCLTVLNDGAGARREFARELEIDPADADAEAQLALGDLKDGTVESALHEAEAAVRLDGNSPLAHNALGWAALANHKGDQAVNEMRLAVRLSPDSAAMHYGLAQALKAHGDSTEANREMAGFQSVRDAGHAPAPTH